jgi:hypothetical protein
MYYWPCLSAALLIFEGGKGMKLLSSFFLVMTFIMILGCGTQTTDSTTSLNELTASLNNYTVLIKDSCWPLQRTECPQIHSGMPSEALDAAYLGISNETVVSCVREYLDCIPAGTSFSGKITYPIEIEIAETDANSDTGILFKPGPGGEASCKADIVKLSTTSLQLRGGSYCSDGPMNASSPSGYNYHDNGFSCYASYCGSGSGSGYGFGFNYTISF